MRKIAFLFIILVALAVSPAFAQEDGSSITTQNSEVTSRVGVSIEPLWLFVKGIGGKIDYAVTNTVSVGVGGMYIPSHMNEETENNKNATSYKWAHNELNVGTNIMLTGSLATNGVYVNPAIGYLNTRITEYGVDKLQGELSTPQFRTTLGYQWINNNIRVAAGGGFKVIGQDEIVVKNSSGQEIFRDRPSQSSGLALDLQFGVLF